MNVSLETLGWDRSNETIIELNKQGFELGRIISEHKERYTVRTKEKEVSAEITGNLRFTAQSREDFPAVGDWVALQMYEENSAIIQQILDRKSIIERKAAGQNGEAQIIATNIDYALITTSVDRDFNINRIERYLTICYAAKVEPIVLLSKIDLIDDRSLDNIITEVRLRIKQAAVIPISNKTKIGFEHLNKVLEKGKTYCFLGSSGVGKSSIINSLKEEELLKTKEISESTQRGKHTTTHRELIILENGSILIDTPGMREVGIADQGSGLETTFDTIMQLSGKCRYSDCTHVHENDCAVVQAVEENELDKKAYENFLKMEREKQHYQASIEEKRKKDKALGKMYKNVMKQRKDMKY